MKVSNPKYLYLNVLFCTFIGLFIGEFAHSASWNWIDGQRVMNQLREGSGLWMIDVRSQPAYETGHIEGSVNIPGAVLAHKKFPAQRALILVDDALGQKAARESADILVKNGHERVSVLEGGIVGWMLEGLPLSENRDQVRGVTAGELKWALAGSVPVKVFDLRDENARKSGVIPSSETVPGKTLDERVEKVRSRLSIAGKKKMLEEKLKKQQPVVLVFSAADDGEGHTRKILHGMKNDVRYLIGGYEAMIADKLRKEQTIGECPTCPREKGNKNNAK